MALHSSTFEGGFVNAFSCNVLKLQDRMFSTDDEVLPLGIMSLSFCTNVFYSSVYHYGCSLMLFDVFWSFGVPLVSLATAAAFMSPLSCCHGGCIYGA